MTELRLGPLLRYVDETSATVWLETDRPCEAAVVCEDGSKASSGSWTVAGHHYALVALTGLAPGTSRGYRVELDGSQVWPEPGSAFPPSTIRTLPADPADGRGLKVVFGSCRWSAPPRDGDDRIGPDALDALATELAGRGGSAELPDVMLLLGDQVYADETSSAVRDQLARRRDLSEPPWSQVADYEEYTRLYDESWGDPEVRWLLSTLPTHMVFDDHDVIDDWNTSRSWLADVRATGWWEDRVTGGLMSYWVYQHLGNLSPARLAEDPVLAQVRAGADGTDAVRKLARRADRDPAAVRWSYRRDFGRVRLVVVDSRCARVLEEGRRAMIDDTELRWLRDQVWDDGDYDHLLVGTSLPWLLPPAVHGAESWDEAMCGGVRGPRWAARGERLRRRADMEHWAAFRRSFDALSGLLARVAGHRDGDATGPRPPATVCVLSGDVHHGYAADARWFSPVPGGAPSRVLQLTCSPVHNEVPPAMRLGFRVGWTRLGRLVGRLLARHAGLPRPAVSWRRLGGPWFGNQLMTLDLAGRSARLRLHRARRTPDGGARLELGFDAALSDG